MEDRYALTPQKGTSTCEWHTHEIEEMRTAITALTAIAAANQTNITALQEWQRQQNGSLKDIKNDVAGLRDDLKTEVTTIRTSDIGAIRGDIKQMTWWLIGGLLTITLLFGGQFFIHISR